ncbi:hypothetical protein MMC14_007936 [Varicellaria rhodocarpa]|nr:hypothetical protein [Varicellaria rhodocarpa]
MPLFNITLKENASDAELEKTNILRARDTAKSQGGKITHEFTLMKGFIVDFPADKVGVLESNEHINVEQDSELQTQ